MGHDSGDDDDDRRRDTADGDRDDDRDDDGREWPPGATTLALCTNCGRPFVARLLLHTDSEKIITLIGPPGESCLRCGGQEFALPGDLPDGIDADVPDVVDTSTDGRE